MKWQMPGNHDAVSAKRQLQHLLANLLIYNPGDATLIDNKQREWSFLESQDEEKFMVECEQMSVQVHPIKNKQNSIIRWVAITRIQSISTIQDWKFNDQFYSVVHAAETYIFPHPFAYDQWDTTTIGFIKNIHTVHYPKELLQDQIITMLQQQNKNPPVFHLIPQRISTQDKKASTKAFTIHCLKDDASQLIHLLTHGPFRSEPNQIFVPFKYKSKNPTLFLQCIRQQNEVYHKTWIVKLEGITPDAMEYIRQDIQAIMGVIHIVPAKRLQEIGEWKLLVDQTKCAFIHRQLTTMWKQIIQKIPDKILESAPRNVPTPTISSKRARDYQDNESDNDSYGSLLTTGTDYSVLTTDESSPLNELPEEFKYPSYASATANSHKSGQDTQYSSPTNSTNNGWQNPAENGWQQEKQKLEERIKAQEAQIEKIQADLTARITRSKDLEDKLADALDLAHSRDTRYVEMMAKFEMLMDLHSGNQRDKHSYQEQGYAASETSLPSTPERLQQSDIPPPSKKANTNSSPHRNIYSIFRQSPSTRLTTKHPSGTRSQGSRKPSQPLLTQPMETDEESRQPKPGAKPGSKIE